MPKIIMLAGAPSSRAEWNEIDLTVDGFLPAFQRFFNEKPNGSFATPSPNAPAWRVIPLQHEHLQTGWSQPLGQPSHASLDFDDGAIDAQRSFLTGSDLNSSIESTDVRDGGHRSQFLEQSFAMHEGSDPGDDDRDDSFHTATTSSGEAQLDTSLSNDPCLAEQVPALPASILFQNISDLPSAAHLHSTHPRVPRVNLIVGVTCVPPAPRTVLVRRTGQLIDLLELLVGDDTRAGFTVTFWLDRQDEQHERPGLKAQLERLRRGNVVLVRNVALAQFRGVVYAQSVRSRRQTSAVAAEGTSVVRIFPDELAPSGRKTDIVLESALHERMREKFQRTLDWTRRFVGPLSGGNVKSSAGGEHAAGGAKRGTKRTIDGGIVLPLDDTQ